MIRLTPDQISYRAKLWLWLINNTEADVITPIVAISPDIAHHALILEHIRAFVTDRVDLANGFELLITENSDGIHRRNLGKNEIQSVKDQLFKEH